MCFGSPCQMKIQTQIQTPIVRGRNGSVEGPGCMIQQLRLYCHLTVAVDKICQGCSKIEVQGGGGAKEKHPEIFTTYTIESDLVNGHSHYTSKDGTMAIAFNKDENEWKIQPVANR